MKVTARGTDELLALMPHLLGFHPRESVVVVPETRGLPVARIDLPSDAADQAAAIAEVGAPYLRLARAHRTRPSVTVICVSEDATAATTAARALTRLLQPAVTVAQSLWASERSWTDLATGRTGLRTPEAANRMAAELVAAGRALPRPDRESLQHGLIGDRGLVRAALPAAAQEARSVVESDQIRWVLGRIDRFRVDGRALAVPDAARLLVAVQQTPVRDMVWLSVRHPDHHAHTALWSDLTRRAPDQVRTPAATLLAFTAWLGGDGALAWTALDQIPAGQRDYRLAELVSGVLRAALPPTSWERTLRPALLTHVSSAPGTTTRPKATVRADRLAENGPTPHRDDTRQHDPPDLWLTAVGEPRPLLDSTDSSDSSSADVEQTDIQHGGAERQHPPLDALGAYEQHLDDADPAVAPRRRARDSTKRSGRPSPPTP